jgi:hypothetical protein
VTSHAISSRKFKTATPVVARSGIRTPGAGKINGSSIRHDFEVQPMNDLTPESLAQRVEAPERALGRRPPQPDETVWHLVAGMFAGSEFMKQVDEEGRKIREAERAQETERSSTRSVGTSGVGTMPGEGPS